jgi:succinate dehydrogenase / fumarate reductase cytochrome b subunit
MSNTGRPLSPHLTIYRWPITMVLSILHRGTGLFMALGFIVFTVWLLRVASGPEQYQYFRVAMSNPVAILFLVGWTFAFFLHLANGVRHLFWDAGYGFEIRAANSSAWFALAAAAVVTAAFWGYVLWR